MKTRTVKISDTLHHKLRVQAVMRRRKLQDIIEEKLQAGLNGNTKQVTQLLRYIDGHLRCLVQADALRGRNPNAYVHLMAGFTRSATRKLARVLGVEVEWSKRR